MKNSAILINVGRGPIVVEEDLADALEKGEIAWASIEARTRLMEIIWGQIRDFFINVNI